MADITSMLKYQATDMKVLKIEDEIEKSPERRAAVKAQLSYKAAREEALKLEKEAGEMLAFLEKSKEYYRENKSKIDELEKRFREEDPAGENAFKLTAQLRTLLESFTKIENNLKAFTQKSVAILKKCQDESRRAKKLFAEYKEAKAKYDELLKSRQDEVNGLKAELSSIEGSIDKELFGRYAALRKGKTMPALIAIHEDRCGGCMMEMSIGSLSTINGGGLVECDFCHRINYKA